MVNFCVNNSFIDRCGWMLNVYKMEFVSCIAIVRGMSRVSYTGLYRDGLEWFGVLERLDPTLSETRVSGKYNWSAVKTIFM